MAKWLFSNSINHSFLILSLVILFSIGFSHFAKPDTVIHRLQFLSIVQYFFRVQPLRCATLL